MRRRLRGRSGQRNASLRTKSSMRIAQTSGKRESLNPSQPPLLLRQRL
jgi:hypothetical protein